MDWMGKEMTSLREEIKKIVLDAIYESVDYALEGKVYNPRITYITNEIISMIEKRIDEMINNFEQQKKIPFKERPILIEHDLNLLRFVKEEILK